MACSRASTTSPNHVAGTGSVRMASIRCSTLCASSGRSVGSTSLPPRSKACVASTGSYVAHGA